MNPIVLIPARMASARLPGKPLADIAGRAMILRVLDQALAAGIGPVAVAAGDPEILAAVTAAGGTAVLTDPGLASGSDRIFAALQMLDPGGKHDAVVNLQGDLPALDPAQIRAVLAALGNADIATLAAPITDPAERDNPAVVKAIVDWKGDHGRALDFTRTAPPHSSNNAEIFHHVGIYAYTRAALARFVALPPSPREIERKLEQLRALDAHMTIEVARVDTTPLSVDTPADLERARAFFRQREKS